MPKPKTLKTGPTETQVLQQVLDALQMFGVDIDRQNTGGMLNPKGQYVAFGQKGNTDLTGMIVTGPGKGKKIDVEVKRPGFDPRKPGNQEARHRWNKQLARIQRTNEQGGYGFWVRSPDEAIRVLQAINKGFRVEVDDEGTVWVTDEELQ